jgi:hypothetical protein
MSTVIARQVASSPVRSAADTWARIIAIIAPNTDDPARAALARVGGVAATLIGAEAPKDDAIVVFGGGPRARIYCIFGDDAGLDENLNEDPVKQSVTGAGWQVSLPCLPDDLEWVRRKLKSLSICVTARPIGEIVDGEATKSEMASSRGQTGAVVNLQEFFKL